MTAPEQPPTCQWCGQPLTTDSVTWWDGRPQCPDPFVCDQRSQTPEGRR